MLTETRFQANRAQQVFGILTGKLLSDSRKIEDQISQFNDRGAVFTVTAGRTGTDTLRHILKSVPGVDSFHEPQPQYRFIMKRAVRNTAFARDFFLYVKVPAILNMTTKTYAETSHLFCKAFLEPALAVGVRPALVFLKRDLRETALSLLSKSAIPSRTKEGRQYLIAPDDEVYVKLDKFDELSDYQLCYWYCMEIAHRQMIYLKVAEEYGLKICEIETGELSDPKKISDLLGQLQLGRNADALVLHGLGKRHNALASQRVSPPDLDAQEDALCARVIHWAEPETVFKRIDRLAEGCAS